MPGVNCRTCEHAEECPLRFDMTGIDFYERYYVDVEKESGYLRDGCVFAEDIEAIFGRSASEERKAAEKTEVTTANEEGVVENEPAPKAEPAPEATDNAEEQSEVVATAE